MTFVLKVDIYVIHENYLENLLFMFFFFFIFVTFDFDENINGMVHKENEIYLFWLIYEFFLFL